ncbi:hypothetical protein LguiA_027102 [Lonicera macranthoides]
MCTLPTLTPTNARTPHRMCHFSCDHSSKQDEILFTISLLSQPYLLRQVHT